MTTQTTDRANLIIGELGRRRVFRAAIYYLVGAWTLVQIAATIFPLFEWPLWTIRAVLYGVLALFPLALDAAWVFDLTPDGLRRTERRMTPVQPALVSSPPSNVGRAFLYVILGVVISSSGFGGYLYFTRYLRQAETELRDQPGETIPARAITLYSKAQMYEDIGRRDEAIELYRTLVLEFPDIEEARQRLAALTGDSAAS
jgi:tetratricopeptide (TPR) repeat protein